MNSIHTRYRMLGCHWPAGSACLALRTWHAICLAIVTVGQAWADDASSEIDSAIDAYQAAMVETDVDSRRVQFETAQMLFRNAVESMENPPADLWVNLGNAALQADDLGAAVAAYRRALQIQPEHRRARANLEHVRGRLPKWTRSDSEGRWLDSLFFWTQIMRPSSLSLVAAIFFGLAAAMIAASIGLRWNLWRNLAVVPAAAWLVLLASLWLPRWMNTTRQAVIVVPDTIGRSADAVSAPPVFTQPIPAGVEVEILDEREDWVQIELANRQTAWVRTSALEVF